MPWLVVTMALPLAWMAGGCDGGAPSADAAIGDAAREVSVADIPWLVDGAPAIAPPALAPCNDGWREVVGETGLVTCDAYPEGGPLDCPAGQAHFPGEPGCASVGAECPSSGEFAAGLPSDRRVVYVRPGATGGDGASPSTPYGSSSEVAIGGLSMRSVIALSRGVHAGPVSLARGVELWGACAAETSVTASAPSTSDGVVTMRGTQGGVRDLTVGSASRIGIAVGEAGAEGTVEGVVVADAQTMGMLVFGDGRLTARDVVIADTRSRSSDLTFGRGLNVEVGGRADVTRGVLLRNRDYGVFAFNPGSTVSLTDVAVRDTQGRELDRTSGRGIEGSEGAVLELTRTVCLDNREMGVFAGDGTEVTLHDVVVRGTQPQEQNRLGGRGLDASGSLATEVSRTLFDGNHDTGVFVGTAGSLAVSDTVVRGTRPQSDGTTGRGLEVAFGARATVDRVAVVGNREAGVFVNRDGSTATFTDVVVRDTDSRQSDGILGRGLAVQMGSSVEATRLRVEGNRELGVLVTEAGASAMLTDVVIRDTRGQESDGMFGRGIVVQNGATGTIMRALLEENRDVGVLTHAATATLADLVIRDTRVQDCTEMDCPRTPSGHGLGSYASSTVTMTRFLVEEAAVCGIQLARDGELDMSVGEIRGHAIGACLQVEGYDLGRLMDQVRFVDNDVNLQSTDLPVPEASNLPDLVP